MKFHNIDFPEERIADFCRRWKVVELALLWDITAIIGQRNILTHEYGEVLIERIWRVSTVFVFELIKLLNPLVPKLPE